MKFFFVLLCGAFLLSCTGNDAPGSADSTVQDSLNKIAMKDTTKYTTIEWLDSMSKHLAKITKGETVEVSWRFRNSGNTPLIIENAHGSCGCTIPEKPTAPIPPGQEGVIKAKFNSAG